MIKFCPVSSGSNGNCIFIGTDETKILIDAGLSGKAIENGLSRAGVSAAELDAILITHEHGDHITGAGVLSRRFGLPIYATDRTWTYFKRHSVLGKIDEKNVRHINDGAKIKDMEISCFPVPHDAIDPVGYSVRVGGVKLCVATDIGHPTDEIRNGINGADVLLLESNHDVEMLENGRYPKLLKERIAGSRGHLSNVQAGVLLAEMIRDSVIRSASYKRDRQLHVFLGHLSADNNRPLIAYDTVVGILQANNINVGDDLALYIADRNGVSEAVVFN